MVLTKDSAEQILREHGFEVVLGQERPWCARGRKLNGVGLSVTNLEGQGKCVVHLWKDHPSKLTASSASPFSGNPAARILDTEEGFLSLLHSLNGMAKAIS